MPYKNKNKRKTYGKAWKKQNREKQAGYNKKYKSKVLDFYRELKERSFCELCNEDRISEQHHIFPKNFSIYTGVKNNYSLARIKAEVELCVALCPTHHRLVHQKRLNENERRKYEKVLKERGSPFEYETIDLDPPDLKSALEKLIIDPPKSKSKNKPEFQEIKIIPKKEKKKSKPKIILQGQSYEEDEPVLRRLQ